MSVDSFILVGKVFIAFGILFILVIYIVELKFLISL